MNTMPQEPLSLELSLSQAEEVINDIGIPPQPQILLEVNRMVRDPMVDLENVGERVAKDISLSGKVLKLASSPFFGGIHHDSIMSALMSLGMQCFVRSIVVVSLRQAFESQGYKNNDFWDHSHLMATLCQHTAFNFAPSLTESAYNLGLFHDLAIALFEKREPAYSRISPRALAWDDDILVDEEELFGTNHAAAGYIIAKSWGLSANILEAIHYHHELDSSVHSNQDVVKLKTILQLCEYLHTEMSEGNRIDHNGYILDHPVITQASNMLNFDPETDLFDLTDQIEMNI